MLLANSGFSNATGKSETHPLLGRRTHLYHGTSSLYLDQMLENGIMPCTMTGAVDMTCLADCFEIAAHHAQHMAEYEEREPVIFRIPVSRFDLFAFTLEDKFVEIGPSVGRGLAVEAIMGAEGFETYPWTWSLMLKVAGAVGYTKPIPVSRADLMTVTQS